MSTSPIYDEFRFMHLKSLNNHLKINIDSKNFVKIIFALNLKDVPKNRMKFES